MESGLTPNGVEPGAMVQFQLAHAVCPDTDEIREKITSSLNVTGRVVFLSDSGQHKGKFAVVEVGGIVAPIIVPVDSVQTTPADTVTGA